MREKEGGREEKIEWVGRWGGSERKLKKKTEYSNVLYGSSHS